MPTKLVSVSHTLVCVGVIDSACQLRVTSLRRGNASTRHCLIGNSVSSQYSVSSLDTGTCVGVLNITAAMRAQQCEIIATAAELIALCWKFMSFLSKRVGSVTTGSFLHRWTWSYNMSLWRGISHTLLWHRWSLAVNSWSDLPIHHRTSKSESNNVCLLVKSFSPLRRFWGPKFGWVTWINTGSPMTSYLAFPTSIWLFSDSEYMLLVIRWRSITQCI